MKRLLLLALMVVGISASAQDTEREQLHFQPNAFGGEYYIGDRLVGQTQFLNALRKDYHSYSLWNQAKSDATTGYIVLYTSSGVFGWGLGWELGADFEGKSSGLPYIVAGGLGLIWGGSLLKRANESKNDALFFYNSGGKQKKIGWKPIANKRGAGIAIILD